jgi:hypothetical protein
VVARARSSTFVPDQDTTACFFSTQDEKSQIGYNNLWQSDGLLDHSPKWSLSKHEAEADCYEHNISTEMMSLLSTLAHEVGVQNEQK